MSDPKDAENSKDASEMNCLQRVKVYKLSDDGKWEDKGTGHVSVQYLERSDAVGLVVIDETDNATLLVHRISSDDIYQRQEDTIISWTDPEVATDLALSFQESVGCSYIWNQIYSVQRQLSFPMIGPSPLNTTNSQNDQELSEPFHEEENVTNFKTEEKSELPKVEMSTLPQISKLIADVPPIHRDRISNMLLRDSSYIKKIFDLFQVCEDLENIEGLHLLYKITKGLILLNDGHIFDILFSDKFFLSVIGALEYDPELPDKQGHRAFLNNQVVFKEAVPIRDSTIVSKIHQTYRIGYLKDVILPRILEDQTFGSLNSMILFNNVEVVTSLQNDPKFLSELFSLLKSRNPLLPPWKDMVLINTLM